MKRQLLLKQIFSALLVVSLCINTTQAQWTSTGPDGGFIRVLTHAQDTLFAIAGYNNWEDLYTSVDSGGTWSPITSNSWLKGSNGTKFSLFKTGNSLFVGTLHGIFRSDDGGQNWVNKTLYPGYCFEIKGSSLFAGTDYGMLRSDDNGETWTFLDLGLFLGVPRSIIVAGTDIYVGVDASEGIYRSSDNGNSWTWLNYFSGQSMCLIGDNLYVGTDYDGIQKFDIRIQTWTQVYSYNSTYWFFNSIVGDENTIYAGNVTGVLRSSDGGNSWEDVSGNGIDVFYNGWSGNVCTQTNGGVYVGTPGGIYRSQDSGDSWTRSDEGLHAQQITYPAIAVHGTDLYAASTIGGIFRTTDEGLSWIDVSDGLDLNGWGYYYGDHMVGADSIGVYAGAYMSTNDGATWMPHNSPGRAGDVGNVPWIESNGVLVTSSIDNGVFRSLDNGSTWSHVNTSFGETYSLVSDGSTLYINCHAAAAGLPSVHYSNDDGANWSPSTFPGVGLPPAISQFVYTGSSMLCATGSSGLFNNGIYRSTDHGASWTRVLANCSGGGFAITEGHIYVANRTTLQNGDGLYTIYHSTNDGLTWDLVYQNPGLLSGDITLLSLAAQGTKVLIGKWTGTDETVMYSSNAGNTWQDITMGGPGDYARNAVLDMEILNGRLYAGTAGGSVWIRNMSDFEIPAMPSEIVGNTTPCIGSVQTYSVTPVPGVTYTWQIPADWVMTNGQGTNEITIITGSMSGFVIVTPSTIAGNGPAQAIWVAPSVFGPNQPIFDPIEALCQFSIAPELPTTSNNGISGIWVPNTINTDLFGTFDFTFTPDSGQCASIYTISVIINELLAPEFDLDNALCQFDPAPVLPDTSLNGIIGTWEPDVINTSIPGLFTFAFSPIDDQCAYPFTLSIEVYPSPGAPVITQHEDTLISSAPEGNQWYLNGVVIPGASEQILKVFEDGDYSVMVTLNGCSSEMSKVVHVVLTNLESNTLMNTMNIYPNPSNGNFSLNIATTERETYWLSIQNSIGTTIYRHKNLIVVNGNKSQLIDLTQMPKGLYIVILYNENQLIKRKILIE